MDKKFKKTTERMDKPDDTLFKRQISYAGDIMHQYHDIQAYTKDPV